jgi:chemotaxis regulatin CheY-phosphate phosphatase CheZ
LDRNTLEKLFEKDDYQRRDEIQKTQKELEKLELRKSNLQNDLMDWAITPQDYQDMKGRVEKELVLLKDKLTDLQRQTSPFKAFIQKEIPMLENLPEYYRKSDGVQ